MPACNTAFSCLIWAPVGLAGDPAEILRDPPFKDNWTVVKVTPSYVNWWLDTVEGIATIVCLSAIAAILMTAAAVAFCKGNQALCFKP